MRVRVCTALQLSLKLMLLVVNEEAELSLIITRLRDWRVTDQSPRRGKSKQIRDTLWQRESMWAWRKGRWGASIKKIHIDSERSSLNTVKNKWTKRELFLKPDHKYRELKSRIFASEECNGISKIQKGKTIPLKDRQQGRGLCRHLSSSSAPPLSSRSDGGHAFPCGSVVWDGELREF